MNRRRSFMIIGLLAIFVVAIYDCATIPRGEDLKESLRKTAEEYWKLRMENNYEAIYKMEDEQGLPRFDQYISQANAIRRINITSIAVTNASVDGDKGEVDLEWGFRLPKIPKDLKQIVKDRWLWRGGKWRHLFPKN